MATIFFEGSLMEDVVSIDTCISAAAEEPAPDYSYYPERETDDFDFEGFYTR